MGQGLEYSKENPTVSSTLVHRDLALHVKIWGTCGRTVLDMVVEPPHLPRAGVCKESETVVHTQGFMIGMLTTKLPLLDGHFVGLHGQVPLS